METVQHTRSWDDLIFENRNKAYGAYAMRQHYTGGLFKSALIAALALAFFIITGGSSGKQSNAFIKPADSIVFEPTTFDIKPDKPEPPKKRIIPPPANPADLLERIVNHDPVEQTPIKPDSTLNHTASSSAATGNGEPTDGIDTGGTSTGNSFGTDSLALASNTIHNFVEIMPAYPGGHKGLMEYIAKNTRYPASSQRLRSEGVVHVQFIIDEKGAVTDVSIVRGVDAACDKEAARVISKMKGWSAGIQNKRPVRVRMVLPIRFEIKE